EAGRRRDRRPAAVGLHRRWTARRDLARRQVPGLPVLVLSQYVEQLYARELLADQAGAVGYLLKDRVFNDDQFTDAVRAVARGGTIMDPEVIGKLMTSGSATSQSPGCRAASARSWR